tara:strand:+ start:8552 stop:8896 length:345 start_codon:yes stop_codon:yes gene_type:complete
MVTVKDYKQRESKDGEKFFVLVLQGGVSPVKSNKTGRMYFTSKTATVPSTFDESTCQSIVGAQFPGRIVKVESEPYEFTIKETGEVVNLSHRWEYQDDVEEEITEKVISDSLVH